MQYRIQTLEFEGEIEVKGNWIEKASDNCKWMINKSFWYIRDYIESREGKVEKIE